MSKHRISDKCHYTNSEIIALIDEYIHNKRNREILKRRFVDGVCFEPLAEEFDMSVRQIKNIVYKEGDKVLYHIPLN